MRRLFVSDVHLDSRYRETAESFSRLLNGAAREVDEIYILGDLFEYWLGDDDDDDFKELCIDNLAALSRSGVQGFFMHGNRDFMISDGFAERSGFTLLPDPFTIDMNGTPLLLSHADLYCTDDVEYQAFRQQVRNPQWQAQMRGVSLEQRRKLAEDMQTASKSATAGKDLEIMDVNSDAIAAVMRESGVHTMLHGHTHRAAIHRFTLDSLPAMRIVLGDWYSRSSYIIWDSNGFEFFETELNING